MNVAIPSVDHPVSPEGPRRPRLLVFDVNETLSDMEPIAGRFEAVGAPAHLAKAWFAGLLRDGFALTVAQENPSFAQLGAEGLRSALAGMPLNRPVEEAVDHIMAGFSRLTVHPDVPGGVRALAELGIRLVTLSNGSESVAQRLLSDAGVGDAFEDFLSVEQAGIWKPAPGAYAFALESCGVDPMDAMLVAAHAWDTDGAHRAGLAAAWINRTGGRYPEYFRPPDLEAISLLHLAEQLR
ncbi:2-haloacid dehalogenase [Promicromonospora umidemergens]|uniref:Haloacid dehalogenase type II n=1 Tax=Promicromonospora umidemergens TaxID=629679 RepID=A0ABP8WZE5_9MICO|nr:haloacid dehalogenase type II [Promicromonospora umidemergens]MCP2285541.1 2-haloacid dehalogenase [Promicromonospora umidemergens]